VADVQAAGGAHAAYDALLFRFGPGPQSLLLSSAFKLCCVLIVAVVIGRDFASRIKGAYAAVGRRQECLCYPKANATVGGRDIGKITTTTRSKQLHLDRSKYRPLQRLRA
jgi:hypothetical protein